MNKVLVVFYSRTGTSRQLASLLAESKGWAVGEITDARPGRGDWRCVLDSLLVRRPPIRYQGPPPEQFDAVVLAAPIWMYRLAGPMRSFVAQYREGLRTVAVMTSMGSRGAPNAVAEIADILGRSPVFAVAFTDREIQSGQCAPRLAGFAEAVDKAAGGGEPLRPATLSPSAA